MMLIVVVALAIAADAPPAPPKRIAVMKTEIAGEIDAAIGPQLTSKLAEEVRTQTGAEVISSDEIVALLKHEKERAILGECKEQESCIAELANALGADVVVTAKLSKITGGYALAVSAVDANSASVRGRVNETWGGEPVALLSLVQPVVSKLFATTSIPKGVIEVVGAVPGSKIFIDDEVRGSAELATIADLLVGAHHVVIQHPDKKPDDHWVIVSAGRKASVASAQESVDGAFYDSWWFWTAAGAGVAVTGAVAAGVVVLLGGGGGKTGVDVQLNADKALGGAR